MSWAGLDFFHSKKKDVEAAQMFLKKGKKKANA